MKKTIIFVAVLGLLASFAYAQPGPGMGGGPRPDFGCRPDCNMRGMGDFGPHGKQMGNRGPHEGRILMWADELGLSDTQIEKIKASIFDHQMAMVDAKAEAKKAQIYVKSLMRDDNASDMEVMDAIDKASMAKAKIAKLRYAHRTEIQSILTQEQQDKLMELRQDRFMGRAGRLNSNDDNWQFRGRRFRN